MTDCWVVKLCGFPGEHEEVAAVFVVRADAEEYTGWWNRGELRRFGRDSTATAVVEETDFYQPGAWRPPARPSLVPVNGDPLVSGSR